MRRGPRLGAFFRARAAEAWADEAVDLEIRHHLEMRIDELIEEGMDEAAARAKAEAAFGEMDRYRAECVALQRREERKMRWTDRVDGVFRDVVLGIRGLRRSPMFALTLLLTLGIGVGANTAIFTVVDAVLIRPLPYPLADRLVDINPADENSGIQLTQLRKEAALAWRDEADFLEAVGFWADEVQVWSQGETATRLTTHLISPELMTMLGVPPLLGRSIVESDAAPGAQRIAILSEERWSSDFGRDPDVLGASIELDGVPHTIVGVMPRSFRFPITSTRDVITALGVDAMTDLAQVGVVGLLPEQADTAVIHEQARAFQAGLVDEGLVMAAFSDVRVAPLDDWRDNPRIQQALRVLMGGAMLILLVAGMNAANLLLVRGSARRSEISVRLALGGGRGRVVRQLAVEAAIVTIASAGLAVLVSVLTLESILAFAPREVTGWSATPVELTGRVGLFTVVLAGLVSALFGVAPLMGSVASAAPAGVGARTTDGRRTQKWRSGLVVGEVALSVVLLAGAGLFAKSFTSLIRTDLGFDAERVVTVRPGLLEMLYPDEESRRAYFQAAREALLGLPGVEGVALSTGAPPSSGVTFGDPAMAEGLPMPADQPDFFPYSVVDAAFADVYGLRFVAGRPFAADEDPEAMARIIDLETARWLFGEDAPIGRRYRMGEDGDWWTVVGVVEDLHLHGFNDAGQEIEWLAPMEPGEASSYLSLSVRTSGDPSALVLPIREALLEIDPNQPVDDIHVVYDGLVDALSRERFLMRLMGVFAALGLGLATLGTFGVVSYVVRRRYREIGVRLALGAGVEDIRGMVVQQGVRLAAGGIVLGMLLCVPLGRTLDGLLRDVSTADPIVLAATALTAFVAAVAATAGPARWATKVDPVEVLGAE